MAHVDYITPIKADLEKHLHHHCNMFKLIGTHAESPRWFNFRGFDTETKILTIGSTQRRLLYFEVQTPFAELYHVDEFWEQFKQFRTEFLKEHHPTINPY